jgi:hypothetical protein
VRGVPTKEQFSGDLKPLRDSCRWTDGYWDFGRDIQILANYLLVQYKARVWNKTPPDALLLRTSETDITRALPRVQVLHGRVQGVQAGQPVRTQGVRLVAPLDDGPRRRQHGRRLPADAGG